jgi:hypothetical protein
MVVFGVLLVVLASPRYICNAMYIFWSMLIRSKIHLSITSSLLIKHHWILAVVVSFVISSHLIIPLDIIITDTVRQCYYDGSVAGQNHEIIPPLAILDIENRWMAVPAFAELDMSVIIAFDKVAFFGRGRRQTARVVASLVSLQPFFLPPLIDRSTCMILIISCPNRR